MVEGRIDHRIGLIIYHFLNILFKVKGGGKRKRKENMEAEGDEMKRNVKKRGIGHKLMI